MIPSQVLHQETVDVQVDVRVAQGTGPPNRHGMPRLPIGQHEVSNWRVLDLGDQPVIPQERCRSRSQGSSSPHVGVSDASAASPA